jgi:hypothetical protein
MEGVDMDQKVKDFYAEKYTEKENELIYLNQKEVKKKEIRKLAEDSQEQLTKDK